MNPCKECGTETDEHPPSCQIAAESYEMRMSDAHEPGYCEDTSGYWSPEKKVIMVPVEIMYHPPTDNIFKFKPPMLSDIEHALRADVDRMQLAAEARKHSKEICASEGDIQCGACTPCRILQRLIETIEGK